MLRFCPSICSKGDFVCTYHRRCWSQAHSIFLGTGHIYRASFFCPSWSFPELAHSEMLWENPWPAVLFYPLQVPQPSGLKWGDQTRSRWAQECWPWENCQSYAVRDIFHLERWLNAHSFHPEVIHTLFPNDSGSFRVSSPRQFALESLLHFYTSTWCGRWFIALASDIFLEFSDGALSQVLSSSYLPIF